MTFRGYSVPLKLTLVAAIVIGGAASAAQAQDVAAQEKTVVIHAGTLIDGVSKQPRRQVTIVLRNDRIVAIEQGFSRPAGVEVIDLSNATVMPGLIDAHVHISSSLPPGRLQVERGGQKTPAPLESVLRMTVSARNLLQAGFTSVRDAGGGSSTDLALKRAIEDGIVSGPRMWIAMEALGPTAGHSDRANGQDPDIENRRSDRSIADTPDQYRYLVREHKRRGADFIKIMPSGGVLSIGDNPHHQLMTDEEIKAAVDTAHELGMRVAAHAAGAKAIKSAIRLGVDSIEHGSFSDAEAFGLFKQHGSYLVPTMLVAERTREAVVRGQRMAPTVAEKNFEVWSAKRKMVADAYKAGVKIAFGSDTGAGLNAGEFRYLVEAGMSPIDAILSATGAGAELIGASADIGSIRAGRFADIIATTGDPLKNVRELEDVDFVMKGGEIVKDKR